MPSWTRVISSVSSALTRRLIRQLRKRAAFISRRSSGNAYEISRITVSVALTGRNCMKSTWSG